jgi:hypothetical protein
MVESYGLSISPFAIQSNHIAIAGIIEYGGMAKSNKYGLSNDPFL